MLDRIRGFWMLWALEKKATSEVKMGNDVKAGWKTSEFWLAVLAQAPTIVGLFLGATNPITIGIGSAVAIGYIIARSNVKGKVGAVAVVAGLQAAAEAAKAADTSVSVNVNSPEAPKP